MQRADGTEPVMQIPPLGRHYTAQWMEEDAAEFGVSEAQDISQKVRSEPIVRGSTVLSIVLISRRSISRHEQHPVRTIDAEGIGCIYR